MNRVSSNTNFNRVTGLSGFDTEQMVSDLMKAEKMKVDKVIQKRTVVEWRRDAYRDVTNTLKGFKSQFFDIVNKSSYMLTKNSVKALTAKSSSSSYLDVSATSDARIGSQTVKVIQVATADKALTEDRLSGDITGTVSNFALSGKHMLVTLDGVTRNIALEDYTQSDIETKLQASLDAAFGSGKLDVSFDSGASKITIGTQGGATQVSVWEPGDGTAGLTGLGLTSGSSNRININDTLANLKDKFAVPLTFSSGGTLDLTINGKLFTFNATDKLSTVFQKINSETDANVTIGYDEITDKVTISSKTLGQGDNLRLDDINGNFFAALGIDEANPVKPANQGKDAEILIDGTQQIIRSSNTFTINGVTYNLKSEHPGGSAGDTVTVEQDIDKAYNNIKTFIDKYNEILGSLNTKVSEAYDRDYLPLTDDQKESMKDADVEKWEKQAKTGLLRNDSIVEEIVMDMRTAMYEKVEGVSLTLKDIGISSTSYLDQGKLTIDENKLKDMLRNKPDEVAALLNGVSQNNPSYTRDLTSAQKADRYKNSGVFQRLSDIIEDNISTYSDSKGNKGILLEKAGIENDTTFIDNMMEVQLEEYDKQIDILYDRLDQKQEQYYLKFSKLEQMLNQMNQQSAWLTSQLGGGQ